jgi:hypothetical protein
LLSCRRIATRFAFSKSAFLLAATSNADERIATQRWCLKTKKLVFKNDKSSFIRSLNTIVLTNYNTPYFALHWEVF